MAFMAGERRRGIWEPVPGPMSSTMPEAVLRSGGIRAEEPVGSTCVGSPLGVVAGGCRDASRELEKGHFLGVG